MSEVSFDTEDQLSMCRLRVAKLQAKLKDRDMLYEAGIKAARNEITELEDELRTANANADLNRVMELEYKAQLDAVRGLPVYDGHFMDSDNRRIPSRVMRSEEVFKALNGEGE